MIRREFLSWCLAGGVSAAGGAVFGQQPAGRAQVQPAAERQERPVTGNLQFQTPPELDALLAEWEQKGGAITKLRGEFHRYIYDSVFAVETRALGQFWFHAPDRGRMDFNPMPVPDPPVNPQKLDAKGQPYSVVGDETEQWICTGKEVFIIYHDQKLYDWIEIPPQQQGQNIVNGPLPFLFGMKAEQAKARYHMNLGDRHWPQGKTVQDAQGQTVRLAPQVHVVAYPKYEVDAREWRRADVLLDAEQFLPRAIKLLSPTMEQETVYYFPPNSLHANEKIWIKPPYPFNERPPRNYTLGQHSRAGNEEPAMENGVRQTGGQRPSP